MTPVAAYTDSFGDVLVPRCSHLVERNGYFTGLRCERDAKWVVNDKSYCTQHAKMEEKKS